MKVIKSNFDLKKWLQIKSDFMKDAFEDHTTTNNYKEYLHNFKNEIVLPLLGNEALKQALVNPLALEIIVQAITTNLSECGMINTIFGIRQCEISVNLDNSFKIKIDTINVDGMQKILKAELTENMFVSHAEW